MPDSPAPKSNILISFLANMRSFLSWFSISSLPGSGGVSSGRRWWEGWVRTSLCFAIDVGGLDTTHCGRALWCEGRNLKKSKWDKKVEVANQRMKERETRRLLARDGKGAEFCFVRATRTCSQNRKKPIRRLTEKLFSSAVSRHILILPYLDIPKTPQTLLRPCLSL